MKFLFHKSWFFVAAIFLMACSSVPDLQRYQQRYQLESLIVDGSGFQHLYLANKALLNQKDGLQAVTIYIEGDGRPYLPGGGYVAADPTPLTLPALSLMSLDGNPAIYLARPCYFLASENCRSELWTTGRYSEKVVQSMLSAIDSLRLQYGFKKLRLVGVSGGAAIAVLLAERLQGVEVLVTVAGNLDTHAWVELHGYLPLKESLEPKSVKAQSMPACQLHLAGEKDQNIPSHIIKSFAADKGGQYRELQGYDHDCCWHKAWPKVLGWMYGS